jgi:hypothetical protein
MKTKVLIVVMMMASVSGLLAQEKTRRFGIELNGGASLAVNGSDEVDLNPGLGFEGLLNYRFMPNVGVYGGWGWNHFGSDHSFAGSDLCFEETGYVLGLEFRQPVGRSRMNYFVRGGGLYNHVEIENADGDIILDSGHGWGWQVAGGLDIPMGTKWSVAPAIRFQHLNREVDFEEAPQPVKYQYLSVRVGIIRLF